MSNSKTKKRAADKQTNVSQASQHDEAPLNEKTASAENESTPANEPRAQDHTSQPSEAAKSQWEDIGAELKAARERKHESSDNVSDKLKIRRVYIEALERGDFESIGNFVYVSGFIRSYANYLGLNGEELIERCRNQSNDNRSISHGEYHFPAELVDHSSTNKKVIFGAIAAVILVYGLWYVGNYFASDVSNHIASVSSKYDAFMNAEKLNDPQETVAEEIAEAEQSGLSEEAAKALADAKQEIAAKENIDPQNIKLVKPLPKPTEGEQASSDETADSAASEAKLVLLASGDTWIKVMQADQLLVERVMKTGDTYFLPNKENLTIKAGNANAIEVYINGVDNTFLGKLNDLSSKQVSQWTQETPGSNTVE